MAEITEDDFLAALEEQQALAEGVGPEEVSEQTIPQQVQEPEEAPAFTQWEDYKNDPRFVDLSPVQKQNLFDDWQNYATQYLAQSGALSTEEDVKYTEDYFTNIAKADNLRKPIFNAPSYLSQLAEQAQSGFGAMEAGTVGYASALGMTDTATASGVISQKYREQRDRYVSPELKKFTEDQLGFFGTAGRILTNPFDIALPLFTQSMASSAPAIAAGAGAGAVGTLAGGPVVGLGAGLAVGGAASGVVDGVITFNQMVIEEVGKRGLDPANAQDVQSVLDDPKFVSDAVAYSAARGVVIGAAELATFGAGKYVASAAKLSKASGLKKVGVGAAITGIETIGEGVGETGAQIAAPLATGKPVELQPGEIAAEMFVQAPGSIAIAGLQTARALVDANAPSSASEVTREAVQAAAEGKFEKVLGVQPSVATPTDAQKYYDSLSIAEKARVLGLAPNAVLTLEQGTYSSLTEEEKGKVQVDFDTETTAQRGPTVEEAEAKAREAFQPTPVAEAPAPAETPTAVAETPVPVPVAETPAPAQPLDEKPITEQETAPLEQVAPASAQAVAEEQAPAPAPVVEQPKMEAPAPVAPAPVAEVPSPVTQEPVAEGETKFDFPLTGGGRAFGVVSKDGKTARLIGVNAPKQPGSAIEPVRGTRTLEQTVLQLGRQGIENLTVRLQSDQTRLALADLVNKNILEKPRDLAGISVDQYPTTFSISRKPAPAPAPAPVTPTPTAKVLPPTKKQISALEKLGYLPADIQALNRTQAKDIIAKQTPKVEAPKEAPQAPAPAGVTEAPVVAPTPVVEPPRAAPAQPAVGEAGGPVAPPASEPAAPQAEQERLSEAEQKLQAKVGEVIAEADKLGVDEESVRAWLGPTPSEEKVLRTRVVLRLLNLGLADVYNNIRKIAAKTRGRQAELTQEGGPKIKRVVFTTREEGAGLLSDPEDMNALDVIYVNPDRLLSRLRADVTTDAADFFVKVLEEELLHLQHGWAAFDLFAGSVPKEQVTPENFKNFFRKQSEEIENSLTLGQIQEVVGKYAGIDTTGKTKEQLIQKFAQMAGRRGRLAEEYLRTLIQRRMLGDITEDKVRGLTPNSVLRSLGMIKNWLGKFVGETIPKKYANQTPVERYYTAVSDLIYGNSPAKIREARDEQGTAISGKETLTASLDPMAVRRRFEQTTYQKELVKQINEDFGLGQPRGARKGPLWAKTVGKLIGQFPTFKPDEVEAIVGEEVPDAVKFFDPSQKAVFSTYLYQRAYRSLLDARGKQRRRGIYEAGRVDVPGSVERARFQPLSEQIKKVEKPKDVSPEATAEEIASELESQESAAEEAANNIVARDADEVIQKYAEVAGKQAEEDQSFEEMMGPKMVSGELTAPGLSPSQAAARSDLSKVFDQLFSTFSEQEQDVFDFLFRANEMENPPTRQGIMAKYNLGHSRQYDRIVESVREKVANTLAENNIFSAGQLSASVDPVELAKRRAIRSSVTKLSDKYKFPVAFVTSDQMGAEIPRLASVASKLQGLKLQPEPYIFNFLHSFENKVDWNKVKTYEQLVSEADDLYEAQKVSPVNQLTVNDIDWSRVETDLSSSVVASPEAGLTLAEYSRDPGEAGQKVVLDYINQKRMESVNEWARFLENNEPNPFMRVLAWSIPNTALRENKIGRSTVALHPGAYTTLRQNLEDGGIRPINFEKTYRKIMADIAKRDLKDAYFVSPNEQWVYIPSKIEDPINFKANVNKLKYLSAITWCTSAHMAEPYLDQGGFWIFLRDNIGTIAIKKEGNYIAEIQGPSNINQIQSMSDELLEKLIKFSDIRPELREGIEEKISEADRMSKEEIERTLQDDPMTRSSSYFVDKIASQGAMTLDQKTRALQYAIGITARELEMATFPENVAEIVSLMLQDQYRLAATIQNGPEADALMPMILDQLYETLLDPKVVEAFKNKKFGLRGSRFLPLVLSRILDSTKVDSNRKVVFVDLLIGTYNFTPVLSSPVYMESREDALDFIKDSLDPVLEKGSELPIEERSKNQDIITAVLKNPLLTKEDIAQTLDTIRAKAETLASQSKKLSDEVTEGIATDALKSIVFQKIAKQTKLESKSKYVSSFYWDLVLGLLQNREGISPSSPPENFFIPRKDRAKWSKAIRIGYFDKYVLPLQKSDLFKNAFVFDNRSLGSPKYRIVEYAEALKDLGDRAVKFVEDVTTDYITFIPEDRPGDKDISSFVEDVAEKLGVQNTSTFFAPVMKQALLRVASKYDRTKEIMPNDVRDWITRNISVVANRNWPSLLTSVVKLFRDSVVVASQSKEMNDLSTQQQLYTSPDTVGEIAEQDLTYLKRYATVLVDSLMYNPEQAPNIELAIKDFIETLLIAKPKVNSIDLLNGFIRSETNDRIYAEANMTRNDYLRNTLYKYNLLPAILKFRIDVLNSLPPFSKEMGYLGTFVSDAVVGVPKMLKPDEPIPSELYDLISTTGKIIGKYVNEMPNEYWEDISLGLNNNTYLMGMALADPNISNENLKKIVFSSEYLRNPTIKYDRGGTNFTTRIESNFYQGVRKYIGWPNSTPKKRKQMLEHLKSLPARLKEFGVGDILELTGDDYAYLVDKLDVDLIPSLSLDSTLVGTEAYYDTNANRLVFVEDNIKNVSRGEQLFYHESTHGNIAYLQTTEAGRNELNQILSSAGTELMARSDYLAQKSGFDSFEQMKLAYSFRNDNEMLGELLARYSEDLAESAPPSWFSQLINDLIGWFKRNLGLDFNRTDLLNWLAGRMQRAATGERLVAGTQEPASVLPSLTNAALTASVDPMATRALKRSLSSVPEAISKLLKARTYFPYENKELLQKANDFVDDNADENDIFQAKIALDRASETQISNPERIITLGVIGKRLKDALYALEQKIKKEGNTPELEALRNKYSTDLYDVLSAAQDILSSSGQDLQAGRVFANLFTPEQMVRVYTKPIADAQKKLLAANTETQKLRALIKQLKDELATKAVGRGLGVIATPEPEKNFYDFLGLFGDLEPNEQESFQEYLTRIGIDYPALMAELETTITASVDPVTKDSPLPKDFRNLNAREAIKQLVGLDKNFFSKLVNLRIKTGAVATAAEVATAQTNKSRSQVSRKSRPIELQMVFDFFNTTEAEKPTSEEPIEKDSLPLMVRLAKYASDSVTDRVLKSLGVDKKTTPKGLFDAMEKQVRKYVNAQFREEMDPQKTSVEDTRTPEQKLTDLVERIGLAEQIFNQTKANLQARLDEDTRLRAAKVEGQMSDADRAALEVAVNRTFDAGKIVATAKEVRQLVDFKAEARKHISQRGATVGSLGRIIKEKLPNLNEAQVKALADLITANYNRLVKESGAKQLNNILKRSITKAAREPKKEMDQMLELLNLGAFDEEKFYNAIADRFGLPTWDPGVAAEIKKKGEAVDSLPQGSDQRTVASLQLQAFIAQKLKDQAKGYAKLGYILDVMGSVWKAGVLSGFGTQSVNLLSTGGNVGLELLASAIGYATTLAVDNKTTFNPGKFIYDVISTYIDNLGRVAPQEAMDAFATGFGRLRSENQKQLTPLEAFSIDTNIPKGAKATAKWTLNNYLGLWKLVGRAMLSTDTFNANIAHEAKLRMQMRYLLMAERGKTSQQADEIIKDLFSADSDMMSGIREQVNREAEAGQFGTLEGIDPKSLAYRVQNRKIEAGKRRRLAQLREQQIVVEVAGDSADETIQGVKNFTQVATFNNNPTGLLGYIGDKIAQVGAGFPLLQPFTSFTRTVANVVNASLNYTPYGFFRLAGGSLGNLRKNTGGKYEFERPEGAEFYKLATQATFGTLALYALNSLFWKDMEEPWDKAKFAVTGLGPSDKNKRDQLRASGWAENSVKVTTPLGPLQFRHSDIPGLSLVLGGLGMLSDSYRYGSLKDADKTTLAAYMAASLGSVVFEKNLLSGAKSLFDILKLREDPVAALQRGAGQYVGGFTNPGAFRWLAQTVGVNERGMVEQIDYRKLNSTVPGFLLGLTPVAMRVGSPRLNRLGQPVEEYPWAASTKRIGLFPEVKPHPVLSPLVGADLFVPGISRLTKINIYRKGRPEQVRVDITEDIYYDYAKYNGQYLGRVLTQARAKGLANRARVDKEGAQEELEDLARQAKKYAVDRIEAQIRTKGLGQ